MSTTIKEMYEKINAANTASENAVEAARIKREEEAKIHKEKLKVFEKDTIKPAIAEIKKDFEENGTSFKKTEISGSKDYVLRYDVIVQRVAIIVQIFERAFKIVCVVSSSNINYKKDHEVIYSLNKSTSPAVLVKDITEGIEKVLNNS